MVITFFIGNGFDLNLGLKTKYSDFIEEYKKLEPTSELLQSFCQDIKDSEKLWSNAEYAMGQYTNKFDAGQGKDFSDCHTDFCEHLANYLKGQEERIGYNDCFQFIEPAFSNINDLTKSFPTHEKEMIDLIFKEHLSEDITINFVNFNYTRVLDRCLDIVIQKKKVLGTHKSGNVVHNHRKGKVYHIHGTVEQNMVFGVSDESQILKKDIFDCDRERRMRKMGEKCIKVHIWGNCLVSKRTVVRKYCE